MCCFVYDCLVRLATLMFIQDCLTGVCCCIFLLFVIFLFPSQSCFLTYRVYVSSHFMLLALFYEYVIKLYILFIHIILINKCNSGVKKNCIHVKHLITTHLCGKHLKKRCLRIFIPHPCWGGGEHSTVGIVTRLQTGGPQQGQKISLVHFFQNSSGACLAPYLVGSRGIFLRGKTHEVSSRPLTCTWCQGYE